MLVYLPFLILLVTALVISLLGWLRPRFSYHWLLAAAGSLVSVVLIWIMRGRLPLEIGALEGSYLGLAVPSLSFRADEISWPIGLAVATLLLAVLLTDASRARETSWLIWAGDLGLTAVGLAAVLAGSIGTMLLAWTVVDVIELSILLRQLREEEMRRRAYLYFGINLVGTMMVLAAMIAAGAAGVRMNFTLIPPEAVIFLILAVGMRVGVLPLQVAFLRDVHHQRGQGTLLRLIPPVVSLPLLAHSAAVPVSPLWRTILLFFAALAAVYGAIAWARSADDLRGRLFWIISLAGMSFASAAQSQPGAVLGWGLAMIYPGGMLFLASIRTKRLLPIGILGLFALSGLPFSPTYAGLLMAQPGHFLLALLPLALVALLYGYGRHMLRETEPLGGVEPWVRVVYTIGLALLPLTFIVASFLGPKTTAEGAVPIWPLLAALGMGAAGVALRWRGLSIPAGLFEQLDKVFSLRWVYAVLGWGYGLITQLAAGVTQLFEGDGGVLWTLLFLVMLISILGQVSGAAGGA